jgi:acetylornithine aminotransferase
MTDTFGQVQERDREVILQTYARYPLMVTRARDTRLIDEQGGEYIDFLSGISVCNLGHSHPEVVETIKEQADKLIHVSNLFYQREQLELASALTATCSLEQVFFCNSGAEANESAFKLARRYMRKVLGNQAYEIVTLRESFHGRTLATLTATGQSKVQEGFDPLPEGFCQVPPEDLAALREAVTDRTAAVMLEVVQGEGGVRPLSRDYLLGVQALCREKGILFMIDEVQTGLGRTGAMWAHQHFGLSPDVITVAKGLGNGLPVGAMLASRRAGQGFEAGSHAATFGGNPLVCRVGSKVLEILQREDMCRRNLEKQDFALRLFHELRKRWPERISEIRGMGLMLGIELTRSGKEVWQELLRRGYVCNLVQGTTLRLLPPFTITEEDIEGFAGALDLALEATEND